MAKLVVVDCEADGPCPGKGNLTELGAVLVDDTSRTFYANLKPVWSPGPNQEFASRAGRGEDPVTPEAAMQRFARWLDEISDGERPVFVSDNPAFDWQWCNYYFWHYLGRNPFGHSARRIGDIYSGLVKDLRQGSAWKRLRDTPHDHHPVHDARGNAEALAKILRMMEE